MSSSEILKPSVLIVDDDQDTIDQFRPALRKDYRVFEANSPHEGLTLARQIKPDFILLDIDLEADIDGIEVLARLKASTDTRSSEVIMFSNSNEAELVVRAVRGGARDYIVKSTVSTNFDDLRVKLRNLYNQIVVPARSGNNPNIVIPQPSDPSRQRVFISYASEDRRFADVVKQEVDKLPTHEAWIDHATLKGTMLWMRAIEQGLDTCSGMVLLLSEDALNSYWVSAEYLAIIRMGKPLIPVMFKKCDYPYLLEPINRIDYYKDPMQGMLDIIEAVKQRIV